MARLIANKKLADRLVFKGGFVGLKVYDSPRYTVDLDALLVKSNIEETLVLVQEQAQLDLNDGVWFRFDGRTDLATQGEYGGIRHTYRAGIGEVLKNIKKAQIINFDLGIGDPITPGPQPKKTPSLFSGSDDISWSVYPVETICAEKLHALICHGDGWLTSGLGAPDCFRFWWGRAGALPKGRKRELYGKIRKYLGPVFERHRRGGQDHVRDHGRRGFGGRKFMVTWPRKGSSDSNTSRITPAGGEF
ncbi:MAG: nucleotidyl transferase AbiEii/AbiGii toxin family protein [Bdellovibrionales bacterium]|nr:nucleotidyl transferase AbiEii/AbiGii toxin family protein [Bdellovibrionales bacterium]